MYEKVATVTVSIEETVSLGQGERSSESKMTEYIRIVSNHVETSALEKKSLFS